MTRPHLRRRPGSHVGDRAATLASLPPVPDSPAGLRVRLQKRLGDFDLEVSWSIGNELAVLFGYSGVGKSISLRMVAGLIRPDGGTVSCAGRTLYDLAAGVDLPPQRRGLGYVAQEAALFPHLDVRGNVEFGLSGWSRPAREERLDELAALFHFQGLEDRRPDQLSGGQRQRVALARAIARRPGALLLDEPFSGLDAPLRAELWDVLHDLRSAMDIPVVLVTHDPHEARTMAERLIVYGRDGSVREGTADELLRRPDRPELQTLLGWDVSTTGVA